MGPITRLGAALVNPVVLLASGASTTRAGTSAAPPKPPAAYAVPKGAKPVAGPAALHRELANGRADTLVLAPGIYDSARPFLNREGDRLYARRLGATVFTAGLVVGGTRATPPALVRGIRFAVTQPAKTLNGSAIHVWGNAGKGASLLDLRLDGGYTLATGVQVRQPEGVVVRRVVARRFTDAAVLVDANDLRRTVARPAFLSDLDLSEVRRPVPKSSNRTAEACLWVGNTATVRRVRAARCAWTALWSGTAANGSVYEDVTVEEAGENGIAVYLEHFNRNVTLRRLELGPGVRIGVICEWADPEWGGRPGCYDVTIENSSFETAEVGVYLDRGTQRATIRRTSFRGQTRAAIVARGADSLAGADGNDYSGLEPTAVPVEE